MSKKDKKKTYWEELAKAKEKERDDLIRKLEGK